MKVAVFFQEYEPVHQGKDPGQIVLGLNDLGIAADMVTLAKPSLERYAGVPMQTISTNQARDPGFWRSSRYDAVIAYTWLRHEYGWIPLVLREAGKGVIVKGDTDGRVHLPLHPMWDRFVGHPSGAVPFLKILRRRIKRHLFAERTFSRIAAHLEAADSIVVETPQAFSNIASTLERYGAVHLIEKIAVIPNPIAPLFPVKAPPAKVRRIMAVGNWEMKFGDYYAKNTLMLCKSLVRFLIGRSDYHAILAGDGGGLLRNSLAQMPGASSDRIQVLGKIPHSEILRLLGESRTLYMPSISEGLSIVASEAVAMGCSLVGGPLESLIYLSRGGMGGTLSASFGVDAFAGALAADAVRWDRGEYSPDEIASYWRQQLDRRRIAGEFGRLLQQAAKGKP